VLFNFNITYHAVKKSKKKLDKLEFT